MPVDLFLLNLAFACWALAWVKVLPAEGHLLCAMQRAWRGWYRARYARELDAAPWWPPLWGCATCHAAQWAFWTYPLLHFPAYHPLLHLASVGVALTTAAFLSLAWTRQTS